MRLTHSKQNIKKVHHDFDRTCILHLHITFSFNNSHTRIFRIYNRVKQLLFVQLALVAERPNLR